MKCRRVAVPHRTPSNGNTTLWVVAALAEMLPRRDLIPDVERVDIVAYYDRAVRVADQLAPLDDAPGTCSPRRTIPAITITIRVRWRCTHRWLRRLPDCPALAVRLLYDPCR